MCVQAIADDTFVLMWVSRFVCTYKITTIQDRQFKSQLFHQVKLVSALSTFAQGALPPIKS